jgi:uncharacterized membrane protein
LPKFHNGVELIIEGNFNGFKTVDILVGVADSKFIAAIGICLFLCCYLKKRKKEKASFDGSISIKVLRAR